MPPCFTPDTIFIVRRRREDQTRRFGTTRRLPVESVGRMSPKKVSPRWAAYEHQVFDLFRKHFPKAKVRKNVMVRGRFSKRKRQIDILITENTPVGKLKTVIDAKYFKKKVDVKAVDGLAGFVDDVGAQKGMLITNKGYSRSALKRAFYGPSDLELDILSFSALQRFQGFTAIPYAGEKAFVVRAPFGWIVDVTRTEGCLATMYQRGLDKCSAMSKKEFLYINFWDRKADPLTVVELDELQVVGMRLRGPVTVSHRRTVQRSDAASRLRIADVKKYKCLEVTGFLEFADVIFFAVLLTSKESQRPNIRRLESVLQQAVPVTLRRDNTALITSIQKRLNESPPVPERAKLLCDMGHWYRDMGQFDSARQALEESLFLDPTNYHTVKELLAVLIKLGDNHAATAVMGRLLRLDPHNPTVFNDCLEFGSSPLFMWSELLTLIDALKAERPHDRLVQANCDYYAGQLLMSVDAEAARQRFLSAKGSFRGVLSAKHEVLAALRLSLRQCRRSKTA
jgi:tetratricopeptide (TPR) repeat protein